MARPSRPPGFDMTYRPAEEFFGPPFVQRVPSLCYLGLAALVVTVVFVVERGPQDSALYRYMYGQQHLIDSHTLAAVVTLSALAAAARAGMRGVRVRGDWLEYRDIVANLWPKVRRIRWAQIDQINIEKSGSVSLDLWDGSRDFLPRVGEPRLLAQLLERVARARAIPYRGDSGLDDLDGDPLESEDA